ncbi:MAG: 5-methyltetrahydropteroyltriglutamate--homocysteine S-methyltransferase [Candidatus Caenarcaniphilales bacterium]|nr:5-methyltetrahydropteroyltriglutamate--homocysteine S-methyltransferase [Candidatus Caenarcaniphilales bacterium]
MVLANNLGFPRFGAQREFKFAIEKFWKGEIPESELLNKLSEIKAYNWKLQKDNGIDLIPSNDYTYYDHILDACCLYGAVPERYSKLFAGNKVTLELYYAMARGNQKANVTAMEMTKWFDTNYHYIVPEFTKNQEFTLCWDKPFAEYQEAQKLGIKTKPVLVGPVTFLSLGKEKEEGFSRFSLLENLTKAFAEVVNKLSELGAEWIQIDEPCLALDLSDEQKQAYKALPELLKKYLKPNLSSKLLLASYFEGIQENISLVAAPLWDGLHVDLVRSPEQLDFILASAPKDKYLSIGLVDGRNIWKNDLQKSIQTAQKALQKIDLNYLMIAPSCSLLHSPIDLNNETKLNPEVKQWLSFAVQKLQEVNAITQTLNGNASAEIKQYVEDNSKACEARRNSPLVHKSAVKERLSKLQKSDFERTSPFNTRKQKQQQALKLPLFPTTTIGSFPQTAEVRQARAQFKKKEITAQEYDAFIRKGIAESIKLQEDIEMDVLVHGEFERNDMVEYFGEYMTGFTTTQNGWVQSYGTRGVKPPIIFGDVSRISPMTVEYSQYAQSLTDKPVKGMLTGPVTILQWSFVRDDQPRSETAMQIALVIIDEVVDLEKVGIQVIQIDEPAFREGLPLKNKDKEAYLKWATDSFRLSSSNVNDETQIHTHMCYSEFNDIISNIADMDADVITIETSRSQMELLKAFEKFEYPNEIGPGVYDIHSPRVPTQEEMIQLLEKASKVLPKENIWVNPDCGLKTRGWEEVKPSLVNMIQAAKELRKQLVSVK